LASNFLLGLHIPYRFDADPDPDPALHSDANPDPEPDLAFQFDPDPTTYFSIFVPSDAPK
jgi:hypothetical protein